MVKVRLTPAIAGEYDLRIVFPEATKVGWNDVPLEVAKEMLYDAEYYSDEWGPDEISPQLKRAYALHAERLKEAMQ